MAKVTSTKMRIKLLTKQQSENELIEILLNSKDEGLYSNLRGNKNGSKNIAKIKSNPIENPDLLIHFSSSNLSLGGFPALMREFAEMIHLGKLNRLNILKFYDGMNRFVNVQQRWGI